MKRSLASVLLSVVAISGCADDPTSPGQPAPRPELSIIGPISQVSSGNGFTCGIGADGAVTCWGANWDGQTTVPEGLGSVVQISTGWGHTCALRSGGSVVCWGENLNGEATVPEGLTGVGQIAAGKGFTCALTSDTSVTCWGLDASELVPGINADVAQISASGLFCTLDDLQQLKHCAGAKFLNLPKVRGDFAQVSAGGSHACAVKNDGSVECWGDDAFGQSDVPPDLTNAMQISAGAFHTCALVEGGTVACWGRDWDAMPAGLSGVIQISAGVQHTCALKQDGGVACWGSLYGGLAEGAPFVDFAVGFYHGCGLKENGTVVCWGQNRLAQTDVPAGLSNVTQVVSGGLHTCAVKADGAVKCWGFNSVGQVSVPAGLENVVALAANQHHTCALTNDGSVSCWGSDEFGQSSVPPALGIVSEIAAGIAHTCAITQPNATISCWGDNRAGQTNTPSDGGYDILVGGRYHTCALKTSFKTITCWGDSSAGQTVNLEFDMTPTSATAGGWHTCVIAGKFMCWGLDDYGQATRPAWLPLPVRAVRASLNRTCALLDNGTIECWGEPSSTTYIPDSAEPGTVPAGNDVQVTPIDETTGAPAPVSLEFDNVIASGTASVTSGQVGPNATPGAPPAPASSNFRLGSPPLYYNITTTAQFIGSVRVCVTYPEDGFRSTNNLRLIHFNETTAAWEALPDQSVDATTRTVCAYTTSFSSFLIGEAEVAPVITLVSLPIQPVAVNTIAQLGATFTDQNLGDLHTGTFSWGSLTVVAGVAESNGAGSLSRQQTFSAPGVYTITATASDGDLTGTRSSVLDNPAYIVVYDPSAGFVTGGGWIVSERGWCHFGHLCREAEGKANFGFVSKYLKGAHTPTGTTEFQFHAGGLNFMSDTCEWLVVNQNGTNAQYKGIGQINGVGAYRFMIWASDGTSDKFRIRIWQEDAAGAETVAYDNGFDQPIGGGSIVIHRK